MERVGEMVQCNCLRFGDVKERINSFSCRVVVSYLWETMSYSFFASGGILVLEEAYVTGWVEAIVIDV